MKVSLKKLKVKNVECAAGCFAIWMKGLDTMICVTTAFAGRRTAIGKGISTQIIRLFLYNDFFKEVMAKYKFRGDYVLGKTIC